MKARNARRRSAPASAVLLSSLVLAAGVAGFGMSFLILGSLDAPAASASRQLQGTACHPGSDTLLVGMPDGDTPGFDGATAPRTTRSGPDPHPLTPEVPCPSAAPRPPR